MLNPIYKAIGYLLAVAYSVVPAHNLGLAIILLTCVVMLALFPLTAKQARSMIQMQRQDFNGRVLTIRGDDLRTIACLIGTDFGQMVRRLDELGLRLPA